MEFYYINVRLVDVERGVAIFSESSKCKGEGDLSLVAKELARKIVARVRK